MSLKYKINKAYEDGHDDRRKQNLDELASDLKRHKNEFNSRCSLKVTKNTEAQKAKEANSLKESIN